MSVFSASETGR